MGEVLNKELASGMQSNQGIGADITKSLHATVCIKYHGDNIGDYRTLLVNSECCELNIQPRYK